jgi:hypothetical protein
MADGFIVRRGGRAEEVLRTANPDINFVSKTDSQIVVTFKNNDAAEADVFYGLTTPLTDKVTLATDTTSSNITFSGLADDTTFTIFAYAIVTDATSKKIKSEIVSIQVTTDEAFSPANLNPQLWLDAADSSTITQSSGAVSQWNNKGSLSNFAQSNSARQPTTGNSTLNGLNVIESDGDTLVATNQNEWKFMHDGTKYLFAAVFRREQDSTNVLLASLASTVDSGVLISTRDQAAPQVKAFSHDVFRGVEGSFAVTNQIQNVVDLNEWYVGTIIADPSNATAANRSELFIDDGTAAKNNTLTNAVSTANPSRTMTVFGFGGDFPNFLGKLAEMIVVSGANATETNRALLRDYLNSKWGVYS